jgi:hypothetical protein
MEITGSAIGERQRSAANTSVELGPLSREALAPLQCVARGYAASEIAVTYRVAMADVIAALRAAVTALGATTVREAIGVAQQRGLLSISTRLNAG